MSKLLDRAHRRSQLERTSCTIRPHEKLEELIEGITANEVAEMMERCYRRGFTQGAWASMDAAKNGHEPEEIRQWFLKLMKWRCKAHKQNQEFPPQIDEPKAKPRQVRPIIRKSR